MSWTDGYISDVRYPAFFYKEMQPLWLSAVAGFQGFEAPDAHSAFALCELGCGVGVNLLVAAACHPQSRFVGVDFNEEHLQLAREAAEQCGIANVDFIHADFAKFAANTSDQFDFITCHGVWSWIAPQHRAALREVASRCLKPLGLFYLHYMCHPGSTDLLPLQHLLNLCAHHMPGPSPRKAAVGMKLLEQIAEGGLFADKTGMQRHLANMAKRDPTDLAHEFLTDHWQPQHSVDVHQDVAQSGLTLIGSADVFNNLDPSLSIPGRLQDLIRRTAVQALAETLKDMARNAHQRMDLFQKDPEPPGRGVPARFGTTRFQLLRNTPLCGPLTFTTPIGPITGPEAIFTPLLQRLQHRQASGAELSQLPIFSQDTSGLLQAIQLLMMQGIVHPIVEAATPNPQAEALSAWFAKTGVNLSVVPQCATALT